MNFDENMDISFLLLYVIFDPYIVFTHYIFAGIILYLAWGINKFPGKQPDSISFIFTILYWLGFSGICGLLLGAEIGTIALFLSIGYFVIYGISLLATISSANKKVQEVEATYLTDEKIYEEKTGLKMAKYFRFPEGRYNRESLAVIDGLGYKTIFWSFAYDDWDNSKQGRIEYGKKKILDNVHNGEIILLHSTSSDNCEILSVVIKEIKTQITTICIIGINTSPTFFYY